MATKVKLGTDAQWGVKENGVLGFNDENNVFKAIELASSRASTATYVAQSGLIADAEVGVPRIDYTNGVGELLLEPQSTNYAKYSEDMSNAVWSVFDVTKAPNTILDPSGNLTGCRVTALSGTNRAIQQAITFTASGSDRTYTGSIYIKSPNTTSCQIRVGSAGSNTAITISSEWQRFDAQYVLGASFTLVRLGVVLYNEGDIVDIAFGQVEELDYATSYIPNTTTGFTTRIADAVTGNSSLGQVINSSEGVLYAEMSALVNDISRRSITLSDGSTSNRVVLRYNDSSNQLQGFMQISGSTYGNLFNNTYDITETLKVAYKWKSGDFSLWINGVEATNSNDTFSISANLLDEFSFNGGTGANPFYGRIREVKVYDTALTDAELTTLTTL